MVILRNFGARSAPRKFPRIFTYISRKHPKITGARSAPRKSFGTMHGDSEKCPDFHPGGGGRNTPPPLIIQFLRKFQHADVVRGGISNLSDTYERVFFRRRKKHYRRKRNTPMFLLLIAYILRTHKGNIKEML